MERHFSSVIIFPQNCNSSLMMRIRQSDPSWGSSYKILTAPVLLQTLKIMRTRNWHIRRDVTNEAVYDPGTEKKRTLVKKLGKFINNPSLVNSTVWILFAWFDKPDVVMTYVNIRRIWVGGGEAIQKVFVLSLQRFFLNLSLLHNKTFKNIGSHLLFILIKMSKTPT